MQSGFCQKIGIDKAARHKYTTRTLFTVGGMGAAWQAGERRDRGYSLGTPMRSGFPAGQEHHIRAEFANGCETGRGVTARSDRQERRARCAVDSEDSWAVFVGRTYMHIRTRCRAPANVCLTGELCMSDENPSALSVLAHAAQVSSAFLGRWTMAKWACL